METFLSKSNNQKLKLNNPNRRQPEYGHTHILTDIPAEERHLHDVLLRRSSGIIIIMWS